MTPEGEIKKQIITYLNRLHRCSVFPIATTGMWDAKRRIMRKSAGRVGTPDILCCISGKFVAIEVKSAKGQLRESQKDILEEISKCGGIAFVARSVDDVISQLKESIFV